MKSRWPIVFLGLVFAAGATSFTQTPPQTTHRKTVHSTPPKVDQDEIDKAMADLADLMKEKLVLDESDKEIARSNQLQIATTQLLDRREDKLMHEDGPALNERGQKYNSERARIIASGCPGQGAMLPRDVAERCRPLEEASNREADQLEKEVRSLKDQKAAIDQERAAVSATTFANVQKRKNNDARRADLEAKKKALEEKLLDLQKQTKSCARLLHQRGVTCEKIKLVCGMVPFDGSDPNLPPSSKDSPCGQ